MPPKKATAKMELPYNVFEEYTVSEPRLFSLPVADVSAVGDASRTLVDQQNGNRASQSFGVTDGVGDVCGRRVVATKDLVVGDVVLMEQCPLWSVLTDSVKDACSGCGCSIRGAPSEQLNGLSFCTAACKDKVSKLSALEQQMMQCYVDVDAQEMMDGNMLRLAVRYSLLRFLERAEAIEAAGLKVDGQNLQASVEHVGHMVEHSMVSNPDFVSVLTSVANLVYTSLPMAVRKNYSGAPAFAKEFYSNCARFNANCHGLIFNNSRAEQFAIGLFPISALFNHSCLPNCIFLNEGSTLRIKVVRDVKKGEELLVNYVALIHSRNSRRQELVHEKGFVCQCDRCSLTPTTQEAYNLFKMEQCLQGVLVQPLTDAAISKFSLTAAVSKICSSTERNTVNDFITGGVYIPLVDKDATVRQLASLQLGSLIDRDALEVFLSKQQYVSSADATKVIDGATLARMEYPARTAVERAIETYTTNGVSLQNRLLAAEQAYKVCAKTLAPGHELFLTLCPLLANIYKAVGDNKRHFELLVEIASLAEKCFSPAMLPLVNYYEATLAACNSFEKEINSAPGSKGVLLKKTYSQKVKDTRKQHTEKLLNVLDVCYGSDHVRYKDVFEKTSVTV